MKEYYPSLYTNAEKSIKKLLKSQMPKKDKRPIEFQESITYAAINDLDPLCVQTMEFHLEILAVVLQQVALTMLPGAIYIAGGVGNYLSDFYLKKQDIFWKHFLKHIDVREDILEKIDIYVLN